MLTSCRGFLVQEWANERGAASFGSQDCFQQSFQQSFQATGCLFGDKNKEYHHHYIKKMSGGSNYKKQQYTSLADTLTPTHISIF